MEPFIAQIMLFGGNFAPRGWAFCDGQLLPISSYSALFSILGTTFGGDGRSTFALPDLRGRVPVHAGTGPGLSTYRIGERFGQEDVALTVNEIPSHNHSFAMTADAAPGTASRPAPGLVPAEASEDIYGPGTEPVTTASGTTGASGGSIPHENRPPALVINYIIALEGIYPSRS